MKIYVLCDMEGISCLNKMEQVKREMPEYLEGRELMSDDINNLVEALFNSGATEITVCDTHGGGGNINVSKMNPHAVYEVPNNGKMMPSLDKSYDGLVLFGHHAKAGTLNGFLDHTMDSSSWYEYSLNGKVMGEIGIESAYAGYFDVPVIMIQGDETTAQEAKELLGQELPCAIVKWGIGRNKAKCLSKTAAFEVVRKTVKEALLSIKNRKPFKPSFPAEIKVSYYRSDMADSASARHGIKRVDARTVGWTASDALEVTGV